MKYMKYIGETSRNIKIRLYEHKRVIRFGNSNDAPSLHISKTSHNFHATTRLAHIHIKRLTHIFEASAISLLSSANTRPGFFKLSFLLVLNSHIISNFN